MATPLKNSQKTSQREQIKKVPLYFAVGAIKLINEMPGFDSEPLYDLTEENISKLQELTDAPFLSFGSIEKYPNLEQKAAVIFCATIRGHKFGNGNKRTAVMLLLAILCINKKWIALSDKALYKLAINVASNTHMSFEAQIEEVTRILSKEIIPLGAA